MAKTMDPIDLMLKIIAGSLGLLLLAGILAPILVYKRKKGLAQVAASAGAVYFKAGPEREFLEKTGLGYFNLVKKTSSQLVFEGGDGPAARYFDGFYSAGSGKHSARYDFTMALFEFKTGDLPAFSLRPAEFLAKLDELFGEKHLKLENAPKFSKDYILDGGDEAAVRALFNADLVAKLEESDSLHMFASGRYLAMHLGRELLPVGDYQEFITFTKELARLLSR